MGDTPVSEQPSSQPQGDGNVIYIWKIPIDKVYVKSLISILKIAATFLSLIAFICVASGRSENCDDDYASSYNYFEFVSISAFLTLMIIWLFFALTLPWRLFFKLVPWPLADLGYCILYIILYLIANIVVAAQSCGKGNNKAGVAFGFFVLFCLGGNAFFAFRDWRSSRQQPRSDAGKSQDYNAERNMEQY